MCEVPPLLMLKEHHTADIRPRRGFQLALSPGVSTGRGQADQDPM